MTDKTKEDLISKAELAKQSLDDMYNKLLAFVKRDEVTTFEIADIYEQTEDMGSEFTKVKQTLDMALNKQKTQFEVIKNLWDLYCKQLGGDSLFSEYYSVEKQYRHHKFKWFDYATMHDPFTGSKETCLDGNNMHTYRKKTIDFYSNGGDTTYVYDKAHTIERCTLKIERYYNGSYFREAEDGTVICENDDILKLKPFNKSDARGKYDSVVNGLIEKVMDNCKGDVYMTSKHNKFYCPETNKHIYLGFEYEDNEAKLSVATIVPVQSGKNLKIKTDIYGSISNMFNWQSPRAIKGTVEDVIVQIKSFADKQYQEHFNYKEKNEK